MENRADGRMKKGMFICVKEIVGNRSGDILDFKMNICYQCYSKGDIRHTKQLRCFMVPGNPPGRVITGASNNVIAYGQHEKIYIFFTNYRGFATHVNWFNEIL